MACSPIRLRGRFPKTPLQASQVSPFEEAIFAGIPIDDTLRFSPEHCFGARAGVNVQALAARLQAHGAASFVKSWHSLMMVT